MSGQFRSRGRTLAGVSGNLRSGNISQSTSLTVRLLKAKDSTSAGGGVRDRPVRLIGQAPDRNIANWTHC